MKHRKLHIGPKGGSNPDINVTPLVDVVLVLLIIFMVVTPMVERELKVVTPPTETVDKSTAGKAAQKPASTGKAKDKAEVSAQDSGDVTGKPTENPAPSNEKAAGAEKPAKKAGGKKSASGDDASAAASTENAAPAKGGSKKAPKAK